MRFFRFSFHSRRTLLFLYFPHFPNEKFDIVRTFTKMKIAFENETSRRTRHENSHFHSRNVNDHVMRFMDSPVFSLIAFETQFLWPSIASLRKPLTHPTFARSISPINVPRSHNNAISFIHHCNYAIFHNASRCIYKL